MTTRFTYVALAVCASAWYFSAAPKAASTSLAPIQWATLVNASGGARTIAKSPGCDGCPSSGGVSTEQISDTDGVVEFTPAWGVRLFAGLTDTADAMPSATSLPFSFSFWADGTWDVRERGSYRTEGRQTAGDVFRI